MSKLFRFVLFPGMIGAIAHLAITGDLDPAGITARGGCPECDLSFSEMRDLAISDADFTKADLSETDLKRAMLPFAIFVGARLESVELERAEVADADFTDAHMWERR